MNRMEFMQALEGALYDVSSEEKEAALQYYNDYLDDAGPECEQSILREWGSPWKLAESIRSGMNGRLEEGEFTETGFSAGGEKQCPAQKHASFQEQEKAQARQGKPAKSMPNVWKWIAIALLCLILAPVCIPVVITIVILMIALLAVVFAVVVALLAAGFAVLLCGLAAVMLGIGRIFTAPAGAAVLFGGGLLLTVAGALLTLLFGWLLLKGGAVLFRGAVSLCRKPIHKNRRGNQG